MSRTARLLAAFLLAGATLVSLAACATGGPEPTPSPTPTAAQTDAPIFASDEEALAAAVAAYSAHLEMTAAILEGSVAPEQIAEVSWGSYGRQRVEELNAFLGAGLRTSGSGSIDNTSLLQRSESAGEAHVAIYACQDVSAVRLFNTSGADVTPSDRDDRVPLVLEFRGNAEQLLVSRNEQWSGDDFC